MNAQFELWYDQEMSEPIKQKTVPHSLFMEDGLSNKIGVRVTKNGEPVLLSGTCYYIVLRSDGNTVYGKGVVDGNTMYATPEYSSYLTPGHTQIFLRLVNGNVKTVLLALAFDSKRTTYGSYIDPSHVIPDVQDIIAKYEEMDEAVQNANAATSTANAAAANANTKANLADQKATLAQQKADLANAAAENADSKAALAQQKSEIAQSKADLAEQKAEYADEKAQLAYEAATIASASAALAVRKSEVADASAANADDKAVLAQQKAEIAQSKADLAEQKAELADNNAQLAWEAATIASAASALAVRKSDLAQEKADLADEKAALANTAAENADEKAQLAEDAATLANQKADLADQKATAANTAANRANVVAGKLENLSAEATTLAKGSQATASVVEEDGHYKLEIGVPKGDTGDQAEVVQTDIFYQVSEVSNVVPTGTWLPEQPITPSGYYLWTKYHKVWNNGQETDEYTVGGRNGLDGSGSVVSVEGCPPSSSGDVTLEKATDAEIDALFD